MLYDDLVQPEGSYLAHHGIKGMRWGLDAIRTKTGHLRKQAWS